MPVTQDFQWPGGETLPGPQKNPLGRACVLACVLLWALVPSAVGHSLSDDYVIRVWDRSRGVQHPTVRSLAQEQNGTILAGTFSGLGQIDGSRVRWEIPAVSTDPRDSFIVSLHVDHQGDIWAGTGRSILRKRGSTWEIMPVPERFLAANVTGIAEDPQGNLFFACDKQVAEWNGKSFEILPPPPRSAIDRIAEWITISRDGTLWAASKSMLSHWEKGQWILEAQSTPSEPINGLGRCEAGGVWVALGNRFVQRQPRIWGRELCLPPGLAEDFTVFAEDKNGNLYAGLFNRGLVIFQANGQIITATEADGLSSTLIPAIMIDRDGSAWLGTGAGGAIQLIPRRFRVLHGNNAFSAENHVSALMLEADGQILAGTHGGHFFHSDGTGETGLPELFQYPQMEARALLRDKAGILWCAADEKGLSYFDGRKWQRFAMEPGWINAIEEMDDGSLWIGHDGGLTILDGSGANRTVGYKTNFNASVHRIVRAPDGAAWLATSEGAYATVPRGRTAAWQKEVAGSSNLFQLAFDPDGTLWATTKSSLIRLKGTNRFEYGASQGVKISDASSLLRDDGGNWWVGQFTGIVRLDRRSLDSAAAGLSSRVPQAFYNRSDGLLSDLAWVGSYAGGVRAKDGRLWIASRRGVILLDPRQFPLFPAPPKVLIEAVISETTTNRVAPLQRTLVLPPNTASFSVEFSAIEPTFGERVLYEYQAGPPTAPWIGLETKEWVRFPSIKPGIFDVRIRASNIDGVTSEEPATIRIEVPAPFWQRDAVQAASALGLLAAAGGGAWAVQRRRMARERVRAEADRRQAHEHARFAGILRATADLVLFAGPNLRVSYINESGRRMLGIPPTLPPASLAVGELLTARSRENLTQVIKSFGVENDLWRGIVDFEWHDGTPIAATVAVLAHRCEDGSIDFYSIVGHDLREVLRAETAKREVQEMLQLVSESVPIRMGFLGLDMRYRWASREAERVLQIPTGQIIGKRVQDIWGDKAYETMRPELHRAFSGEGGGLELPVEIRGAVRHYAISFLPHFNRSSEVQGVLLVAVDLTGQRESTERQRSLEDQLQQRRKLEALGTLAGGVAHDFNNLLSVIVGNLDLARCGGRLPDETAEALDEIQKASQRARDIVRQILLFSRQQSQRRDAVQVGAVVHEAVSLLRPTIPGEISLIAEVEDCPPVLADVTQIHQVILNLVTNAIQAIGSRHGLITVRLRQVAIDEAGAQTIPALGPGGYVRLTVTDNGTGMDEATMRRIFEPFFTTKPVGQGTGLGLAVVHGIVDTHGGAVSVESKVGFGTTFAIHLPAIPPGTASSNAGPSGSNMALGQGQNVMLVDDEAAVLTLGKAMLGRLGYAVESFQEAHAAAQCFEADPKRFDLVLTDLTMPLMNGLELSKRIRAASPRIPIILASGMAAALNEEDARVHGVTRILAKPYRLTELAVNLAQLIGPPRGQPVTSPR